MPVVKPSLTRGASPRRMTLNAGRDRVCEGVRSADFEPHVVKASVPWPCDGLPTSELSGVSYPRPGRRPGDRGPGESLPALRSPLSAVSSAARVMGFRSFDLDELSEQMSSHLEQRSGRLADRSGNPDDLFARRNAASVQDALDAHRWEDDGGSVAGEVALKW